MLRKYDALPPSLPPRGLNREAAARYVGVSPSKFDELVDVRTMPRPKKVGTRNVWDRLALDAAFEALPSEDERNEWDLVLAAKTS